MRHPKVTPVLLLLLCLVSWALGGEPESEAKPQEDRFLRLVRDEQGSPVSLEAAVVHYVPSDRRRAAPTVDLISAVHVAEKSYYDEINRLFSRYDAVLYELVAPEGTRIAKGEYETSANPLSLMQGGLTELLELKFQLREVDYTGKNLVHADMSPEQFADSMRQRGESVFQVFFRMLGYAMARQAEDPAGSGDFRLLMALFDKNRALAVKRIMAEQFEDLEGSLDAIEGPDGSTLIAERNKIALGVLRREIGAGKRKLAIFYGAGHMPDFQERLRDDFGLVPAGTRWLVAWNLKSASSTGGPSAAGRPPK